MTAQEYIVLHGEHFGGGNLQPLSLSASPHVAVNPSTLRVRLAEGVVSSLTVLHTTSIESQIEVELERGAVLNLYELYTAPTFCQVNISSADNAECNITSCVLDSANVGYRIALDGTKAATSLRGVFVTADTQHAVVNVEVRHNASDCKSISVIRGVASGTSTGEFHGLVYVAPDAQRTDAQQQSRNLQLSEKARIVARPQLEIYADDVRCTHGATVGQMNDEAVMYMRQRGLSEQDARRLQVEGFVEGVAADIADEELRDMMIEECAAKIEKL